MKRPVAHLLIIDPQNDFCDLPESHRPLIDGIHRATPSLPVPGAHADMVRVAEIVEQAGAGLSHISITLDSHQHFDIGHPTFWVQGDGSAVAPFTQIHAADVRSGRFKPRLPGAIDRVVTYLSALESSGRYVHMVWPIHCEIGTWGHNVHNDVRLAYNRWEEANNAIVKKVTKGTNPWTEHYSAIKAEVPDPSDVDTQVNRAFLAELNRATRIFITGEAGSHCVKATTEHIVEGLRGTDLGRLVIVKDCMSAVAGFEAQFAAFLSDMENRGLQIRTAADVIADLRKL